MKIPSNVTEKILSTVFSKFLEKTVMLEFNIAYLVKWYFGSDYVNCTTESSSDCTQENENCVLCNI